MSGSGDYISREAAKKQMRNGRHSMEWLLASGAKTLGDLFAIIIDEVPAADVRPVVRGKWIQTTQPMGWRDEDCAECSVCGEDFVLDEWAMDEFTNLMNFCPNCGADMRVEPPKEET